MNPNNNPFIRQMPSQPSVFLPQNSYFSPLKPKTTYIITSPQKIISYPVIHNNSNINNIMIEDKSPKKQEKNTEIDDNEKTIEIISKMNIFLDNYLTPEERDTSNIKKFKGILQILDPSIKNGSPDKKEKTQDNNNANDSENRKIEKYNDYILKRKNLINHYQNLKYEGYSFTENDEKANKIFTKLAKNLRSQLSDSFYKEYTIKHKEFIENTNIYKILKKMPKGANLHLHVDTAFDPDWYLNFAYHPNAYIKLENGRIYYRKENPGPEYIRIVDQRNKTENTLKFDEEFKKTLTINYDDIKTSKNIWSIFQEKLWQVDGLLLYEEYFYQYLVYMSKKYISEGVYHIEAKIVLGYIVDENGKPIDSEKELEIYRKAIIEIKKEDPYFSLKLVVQGLKGWSLDRIDACLKNLIELMKKHGDLILGFDLVQEEDKFKSIFEMAEILIKKEEYIKEAGIKLDFVLHGGESLKFSNQNLFDLILLKSKRIGHALNLTKHSYLMDIIKKEKIGIEICPCSNQILNYIYDLRLHPGITYLNKGLKVIICPDDPGYFHSNYITFDFFMTVIAMEFNFKDLKMCCLNSLECSLLIEPEKQSLINFWNSKWDQFTSNFLKEYSD